MVSALREISGQQLGEYLWPNVLQVQGRKTALYEGAIVAACLALIYAVHTLLLYVSGVTVPEEFGGLVDEELFLSVKAILYLTCLLTGLYYIHSIGRKESAMSVYFLFIWVLLELFEDLSDSQSFMVAIDSLLLLGSLNCLRAIRSPKQADT